MANFVRLAQLILTVFVSGIVVSNNSEVFAGDGQYGLINAIRNKKYTLKGALRMAVN